MRLKSKLWTIIVILAGIAVDQTAGNAAAGGVGVDDLDLLGHDMMMQPTFEQILVEVEQHIHHLHDGKHDAVIQHIEHARRKRQAVKAGRATILVKYSLVFNKF